MCYWQINLFHPKLIDTSCSHPEILEENSKLVWDGENSDGSHAPTCVWVDLGIKLVVTHWVAAIWIPTPRQDNTPTNLQTINDDTQSIQRREPDGKTASSNFTLPFVWLCLLTLCSKGLVTPPATPQPRPNRALPSLGTPAATATSLEKMTKQMTIQQQFQFVTDEDDEEISLKVESFWLWV